MGNFLTSTGLGSKCYQELIADLGSDCFSSWSVHTFYYYCLYSSKKCYYIYITISSGVVSSKIYNTRDDFDFDIVNFPFLDGDVPLYFSSDFSAYKIC